LNIIFSLEYLILDSIEWNVNPPNIFDFSDMIFDNKTLLNEVNDKMEVVKHTFRNYVLFTLEGN